MLGYTDKVSVRAGQRIGLRLSSATATECSVRLCRLTGSRWNDAGLQPDTIEVEHIAAKNPHACGFQAIPAGSYGQAPAPPLPSDGTFGFGLWVQSTAKTPGSAVIMSIAGDDGDLALGLDGRRRPVLLRNGVVRLHLDRPLQRGAWTVLVCTFAGERADLSSHTLEREIDRAIGTVPGLACANHVTFAARMDAGEAGSFFDGRLADPTVATGDGGALERALVAGPAAVARLGPRRLAAWDFACEIASQRLVDTGPSRCDGHLVNRPARAVTGPFWDGSVFDWRQAPHHYGAIHFHSDDLDDCRWEDTVALDIPDDWTPGLYLADVRSEDGVDQIPFVVRSSTRPAPRLAVLLPTFTYLSYGNAHPAMRGPDFGVASYPDEARLKAHPELGKSQYDLHDDRSPVMFSSPRRPLMSMRFGTRPWGLPVDAALLGYLEHIGVDYDLFTDADLHAEGYRAVAAYDCVLTGNHPEYCTTEMLNALEAFTHRGGRLMYLGGNGFYWRVSVCPQVGTIEVRRTEDGTRAWIAAPGEGHHAMDGRYGGLWRRLGRPPNRLVTVGFAAQGDFAKSGHYQVSPDARAGIGGFALDGVESDMIGDYGWLGGGAAGQEIDRADTALGTAPDAVVLASSTGHGAAMMRTIEEMLSTVPPFDDPKARADVTFHALPGGGAVFSVGSMTWIGALDHQGYDNDVARITGNVIRRFLDPEPFVGDVRD